MFATTILALSSVLILSVFSPLIFQIWIKASAGKIPGDMIWSYGSLSILLVVGNAFAMFLNGLAVIKSQVVTTVAFCILAIPLKYFGAVHFGVVGLITASIIAYILAVVLPYLVLFKLLMKKYVSA
jgi:hypothetical protein